MSSTTAGRSRCTIAPPWTSSTGCSTVISGGEDSSEPGRTPDRLVGSNQLRLLFHPEGIRPLTVNFDAVGRFLLDRLEEEIALHPDDRGLEALRRDLEGYGPVPDPDSARQPADEMPALPIHLRKEGTDLRLLSFLVTVAAPREVGLQETRMETFLPADEQSGQLLERLAAD